MGGWVYNYYNYKEYVILSYNDIKNIKQISRINIDIRVVNTLITIEN